MAEFFSEWAYVPVVLAQVFSSPMVLVYLLIGLVLGYTVGVIPGLGPTMGMALLLGIVFKLVPLEGMALLIGVMVASLSSGGITASLVNIPGTSAAAATTLDGYPMTKQGKGRDAAGLSYMSSVIGSILGSPIRKTEFPKIPISSCLQMMRKSPRSLCRSMVRAELRRFRKQNSKKSLLLTLQRSL